MPVILEVHAPATNAERPEVSQQDKNAFVKSAMATLKAYWPAEDKDAFCITLLRHEDAFGRLQVYAKLLASKQPQLLNTEEASQVLECVKIKLEDELETMLYTVGYTKRVPVYVIISA